MQKSHENPFKTLIIPRKRVIKYMKVQQISPEKKSQDFHGFWVHSEHCFFTSFLKIRSKTNLPKQTILCALRTIILKGLMHNWPIILFGLFLTLPCFCLAVNTSFSKNKNVCKTSVLCKLSQQLWDPVQMRKWWELEPPKSEKVANSKHPTPAWMHKCISVHDWTSLF